MTIVEKIQDQLKKEIKSAVVRAGLATDAEMPEVVLETPKDKAHGDYATNMAMQLARIAKKNPRQIADEIKDQLDYKEASVKQIDVAGPGFINFFMDNSYLNDIIPTVLKAGAAYGASDHGKGKKVQNEFVSANPTGTLHLGHARGAAVGDALNRILEKAGYAISREYYINDAGNQINNLARSIEARFFEALGQDTEFPEDGYRGKDIIEIGEQLAKEKAEMLTAMEEKERIAYFRKIGVEHLLEGIKQDLKDYGVQFDNWFSETTLYESGEIEKALDVLKTGGHTYEAEGALWFKSTEFGDDKDRVLIKSDGSFTYLTPDIAYHRNKLQRGYEKLINIWGADHHGYIPRMKAAIEAMGYAPDALDVQIIQMVRLIKDGEVMKMSKRTGKAVTLRELMEEVGVDAMRYFFAMRSTDSQLDFDIDLARSESNENPVYYVQYAHARLTSLLKRAADLDTDDPESLDFKLLQTEKEIDLLKKVGDFPQVVAEAADRLAAQRVTNYVFDLAGTLHSFYNAEKVIDPEDPAKSRARVALMKAVRETIASALDLIGVHAPESM